MSRPLFGPYVAAAVLLFASRAHAQCSYEFVPIYAPPPYPAGLYLYSISEGGWCGGSIATTYGPPIVVDPTGSVTLLPTPPGGGTVRAVTDNGIAVGEQKGPSGSSVPAMWLNGVPAPLPTPFPVYNGSAADANEAGYVVGFAYFAGSRPFGSTIWKDGELVAILNDSGSLRGISKSNEIAGQSKPPGEERFRTFRLVDGVVTWLPLPRGMLESKPFDISSNGCIVGVSRKEIYDPNIATVWRDDAVELLPMIEGYARSSAWGVNALGQVIGKCYQSYPPLPSDLMVLWQDGQTHILFTLLESPFVGTIGGTGGINDRGEICGSGWDANGIACGFVLRPIRTRVGDVTIDCHVDERDLTALFEFWGERYAYDGGPGDLDGDGEVGSFDLAVLLGDWDQ